MESDEVIDLSQKAEKEGLPVYKPNEYYPTRIGSVINDRGQVVSKPALGRDNLCLLLASLVDTIELSRSIFLLLSQKGKEVEQDFPPGRQF